MASDGPSSLDNTEHDRDKHGKRGGRISSLETRVRIYCLIFSIPAFAFCVFLVWTSSLSVRITVITISTLVLLLLSSLLIEEVVRPLQTLANVVAALREDDYSFRARGSQRTDALGELSAEINALADMLQSQRLGELEASFDGRSCAGI
jgi:methyl-accepting chemotaxis protein